MFSNFPVSGFVLQVINLFFFSETFEGRSFVTCGGSNCRQRRKDEIHNRKHNKNTNRFGRHVRFLLPFECSEMLTDKLILVMFRFFFSKIHILGSYQNIRIARTAICNLILGSPPSKVYGNMRAVASRTADRF